MSGGRAHQPPHCIVRRAVGSAGRPPLLFMHGAFCGAWCWDEHFLGYFAARGHDAWAVDLRGHGADAADAGLAGVEDYVEDVLAAAAVIGEAPVLLGHSMGAIVIQRAWRRARARALALLAPVPLSGLLGSTLMLALNSPEIFNEINKLQFNVEACPAPDPLRQAIFSARLPAAEAGRHLRRMRHESQRALFDLSWPQRPWIEAAQLPVGVFAAAEDRLFPPSALEDTAQLHGGSLEIVPGLAHAMMLDAGWQEAAARIDAWLSSLPR